VHCGSQSRPRQMMADTGGRGRLRAIATEVPVMRLAAAALLVMLAAPSWSSVASAEQRQYDGHVVDVATKQAQPGSVITVIWMKYPVVVMDGVSDFHAAREVLTDEDAQFTVDATPPFKWIHSAR
jgi:hypothetical protein